MTSRYSFDFGSAPLSPPIEYAVPWHGVYLQYVVRVIQRPHDQFRPERLNVWRMV